MGNKHFQKDMMQADRISMEKAIQRNFLRVLERIEHSARQSGRNPDEVKLIVVTKGQPIERIRTVLAAGARRLGENYVEEATPKILELGEEFRAEWHMIGHVQSRKAEKVCDYFDWIHSLDSLKLATRMNRFAYELGRQLPVLLEFNVSGEESKTGYQAWEKSGWPGLIAEIETILDFQNLLVRGLMIMPPFEPDPEAARPYFRHGRELRDFLSKHISRVNWQELSMGMSNDFEIAIQEAATIVRIGQAILGERQY